MGCGCEKPKYLIIPALESLHWELLVNVNVAGGDPRVYRVTAKAITLPCHTVYPGGHKVLVICLRTMAEIPPLIRVWLLNVRGGLHRLSDGMDGSVGSIFSYFEGLKLMASFSDVLEKFVSVSSLCRVILKG